MQNVIARGHGHSDLQKSGFMEGTMASSVEGDNHFFCKHAYDYYWYGMVWYHTTLTSSE